MVSEDGDSLVDEELEWELEEGIPQVEDLEGYFGGREKLIANEKKLRHDHIFKQTMSPLAKQAAKIMSSIRRRDLADVWTSSFEESLMDKNGGNLYPGMMFTLARDRLEQTELWRIIERMPKGALLHAHLDAMIDIDWLVEQMLSEKGMCILAQEGLSDKSKRALSAMRFRVYNDDEVAKRRKGVGTGSVWSANYVPFTPIPVKEAARMFPDDSTTFKKWLISRCVITEEESLCHHHGVDAVWRKFQSTFPVIGEMMFYEPIFRRSLQRLLEQLASDGITYVDLRCAFKFEFRRTGQSGGENGFMEFFEVMGDEIEEFKKSDAGRNFQGARMIWTVIRKMNNRQIIEAMKECIRIKKKLPHLICGFDLVAQEDQGRTLKDLTPLLFWFRKKCVEERIEVPFFFHAGECLGDGDSTDNNLFDAVLLGTRRIGHGYSLYKHPLLIDMVKEKKILVESCPISNEILRLSSSILGHSLPALLSRGVPVSLNNDDPAILGHGKNGLSHDFWQSFMAFENMGLEGLATMAENSLKWCAVEDQKAGDWLKDISEGYMGKGTKAKMLKLWRTEFEKWCQWIIMEYPLETEDEDEEDEDEDEEDDDDDDGDDEDDIDGDEESDEDE